jgi:hypothetical protein
VGFVSDLGAMRPVAVAGRFGALICDGFVMRLAMGGAPRAACRTSDVRGSASRFRGCGLGMAVARARDTADAPCVPLFVCPVRWVVCKDLADVLGVSPASRSPEKGLESSADIEFR